MGPAVDLSTTLKSGPTGLPRICLDEYLKTALYVKDN